MRRERYRPDLDDEHEDQKAQPVVLHPYKTVRIISVTEAPVICKPLFLRARAYRQRTNSYESMTRAWFLDRKVRMRRNAEGRRG